jgi:hypothetical protein
MSGSRHTAVLFALLTAAALAGCTSHPTPTTPPRSANPPSPVTVDSTSTPPIRLQPPSEVAGELSRRVLAQNDGHPDNQTVLRRNARGGLEYAVQAACTSTTPGKTLSVEVRSGKPGASDDAMVTTDIPCDGKVTVNGVGDLPAEPIIADLRGNQSDVLSAYAIVAPADSLPASE